MNGHPSFSKSLEIPLLIFDVTAILQYDQNLTSPTRSAAISFSSFWSLLKSSSEIPVALHKDILGLLQQKKITKRERVEFYFNRCTRDLLFTNKYAHKLIIKNKDCNSVRINMTDVMSLTYFSTLHE